MYRSLCYAKKFAYVLDNGEAQTVLSLPVQKRLLVMESLATLSKYLGCYDKWKLIRERYHLKWSAYDSLHVFNMMHNSDQTYSNMINWLRDTCAKLPKACGNILIYNTLTGLRPTEACESIKLVHEDLENYLKTDTKVLEHYKYPTLFLRKTKQAYISIITDEILQVAKQSTVYSYNAIRMIVRKMNLPMNMSYCRKIFATYLRNSGISIEYIDMLQGRIPKSVFTRHYFRPDFDYNKIRQVIRDLFLQISSKSQIS